MSANPIYLFGTECETLLAPPPAAIAPTSAVRWPSLKLMLKHMRTRPSNVGRRLVMALSFLQSTRHRAGFEAEVSSSPIFQAMQRRGADAYMPLFRAFLDSRFGMRDRFDIYRHSISTAENLFSPEAAQAISRGERLPVARVGEFLVDLGINEYSMEEGLWSMTLRDPEGRRLSNLSFSFLTGSRLLIGAVQGPKMQDSAALEGIRAATHALHGMRPPHFVIAVLKCLAHEGGFQLLGVDPQVKARLGRGLLKKGYHFDYRAFWAELGGRTRSDHYWELGTVNEVRSQEDVPSRKRAMYRRRGEMIAGLSEQIQRYVPSRPTLAA